MALTLFVDVTFFTILPSYLREILFNKSDTAFIVSFGAGADLSSRVFVTLASSCFKIKARELYLAGVIATIGAQLGKRYLYRI